jgi:2'-5' RNA ligase
MHRHAIYFAPTPDSALERFGRIWFGTAPPAIDGIDRTRWDDLLRPARHYGFHATLKPPFRIADGRSRDELVSALAAFASGRSSFSGPPLRPAIISGFIALRPVSNDTRISTLAADCVEAFDAFRAPADGAEIARRRRTGLSERQDALLARWGYPYVFEEFRFHMTLTGRVSEEERTHLLSAASSLTDGLVDQPTLFDALSLFEQDEPDRPFRLTQRFPFDASHRRATCHSAVTES